MMLEKATIGMHKVFINISPYKNGFILLTFYISHSAGKF
jgi:hypothetical protein